MLTNVISNPMVRLSVAILVNGNLLRSAPALSKDIKHRSFARWSSRKPSKVFTPEKIESGGFDTEEFFKSEYTESIENKPGVLTKQKQQAHSQDEKGKTEKLTSSAKDFIVLEENDSTLSKLMTQVGNRKLRKKNDLIMLEGKRLNIDAIQAGLKPQKLFFSQKSIMQDLNLPQDLKTTLYKIPYKTITLWSKLDAPPGIIGFYRMPKEGDIEVKDTIPVKVICDNVRDPGNMGSIIRVAASVGCTEVVLLKGCTDPWDCKVLRSASGGHFHIPIKMDVLWSQHQEFLNPSDVVCLADSRTDRTNTVANEVPQRLYFDMNYETPHSVAVVVGGETEGLSNEVFKLAAKYNSSRLYIPLSNKMESLNSGCALSVLLFEIKRQFLGVGKSPKDKQTLSKEDDEEMSVRVGI